jgi:hypothetical protein
MSHGRRNCASCYERSGARVSATAGLAPGAERGDPAAAHTSVVRLAALPDIEAVLVGAVGRYFATATARCASSPRLPAESSRVPRVHNRRVAISSVGTHPRGRARAAKCAKPRSGVVRNHRARRDSISSARFGPVGPRSPHLGNNRATRKLRSALFEETIHRGVLYDRAGWREEA